jgi:hypothetical protein
MPALLLEGLVVAVMGLQVTLLERLARQILVAVAVVGILLRIQILTQVAQALSSSNTFAVP